MKKNPDFRLGHEQIVLSCGQLDEKKRHPNHIPGISRKKSSQIILNSSTLQWLWNIFTGNFRTTSNIFQILSHQMLPNQLSESPVSFAIRGVDYESVPKILPGGPRITTPRR